jgi:hypothetical protein
MTTEEALAHLGIAAPDEAEDAFEMALFETQQFLLSKPVFLKTVESRLSRLEKQRAAFVLLGGQEERQAIDFKSSFQPSEEVLAHFLNYHQAKNTIRQALSAAVSADAIREMADRLLALERTFAEPFSLFPDWTEATVTIGKEPDSMDVLTLLREQAAKGRKTLPEIQQNINDVPAELLLVLKRLSLLKNYLYS